MIIVLGLTYYNTVNELHRYYKNQIIDLETNLTNCNVKLIYYSNALETMNKECNLLINNIKT